MGKMKGKSEQGREVVIPYARAKLTTSLGGYEFYYPKGIRWSCKRCGACCRDASHRSRRILLLPSDVARLEKAGEREFTAEVRGEEPFIAEMKKVDGACVNLTKEGCRVYPNRALLCRMYPLWVEKDGRSIEVMVDTRCTGFERGPELKEEFYRDLLVHALEERGEE
jgi:Fe-S-cluster containining protein